jgi:F-type H+-transporting ATPase subunit alpha
VARLKETGAMDYTVVVSATASDSASLQYIALLQLAQSANILWKKAKTFW